MIASDEIIVPQAGHAVSDSTPELDSAWTTTFATGLATGAIATGLCGARLARASVAGLAGLGGGLRPPGPRRSAPRCLSHGCSPQSPAERNLLPASGGRRGASRVPARARRASSPSRGPAVGWNRIAAPGRRSLARSARVLSRGPASLSLGRRGSPVPPPERSAPVRGPGGLPRSWPPDLGGLPRAPFCPHLGTSGFLPLSSVRRVRLESILRPFMVPSAVRAWRRAPRASAYERTS